MAPFWTVQNEPFLKVLRANSIFIAAKFFDLQCGTFNLFLGSCKIQCSGILKLYIIGLIRDLVK